MSKTATPAPDDDTDALQPIRENREALENVAEGDDRLAAIARYLLAVEAGEAPDDYDARLAGLPELGGED